ncbi:uncharacterized protein LOC135212046 [Macrobrachium nipponense]|uniref:uncharacterized protein LOC135212046 n=1 Tax=Macrobrachium nipponense TaxID=159736 RepID=UPI0030C81ED3
MNSVMCTMLKAWAFIALLVCAGLLITVDAAPSVSRNEGLAAFRRSLYGAGPERRMNNQCSNDNEKQYMCEMCAKETKSPQIYTLCCTGADNAQNWCQSFLLYGINSL